MSTGAFSSTVGIRQKLGIVAYGQHGNRKKTGDPRLMVVVIMDHMFRLLIICLLLTTTAQAWNSPGHQVIDLIAWSQLEQEDRSAAVSLLKDHPRFEQHFLGRMPRYVWDRSESEKDQWIFAIAGTWPDQVRGVSDTVTREDVERYNRGKWHYINLWVFATDEDRERLADGLTNNRETEPPDNRDDPEMNVAQAAANALRILRDGEAKRGDRAVALCWVLHLVADAHQPCHAAALYSERWPRGDRGANQIPVRGEGRNLHSLWDQSILPYRVKFNDIRSEAVELAEVGTDVEVGKPKDWLRESHKLAKLHVYTPFVLEGVEGTGQLESLDLPPEYREAAGRLSKQRATEAGFRLGELLSGALPGAE